MSETTGFVIKQSDYRDNDALIQVFTKDYGLISLVARGVRKTDSKNAAGLYPLSFSTFTFDYKENKTLFSLQTVRLIRSYPAIQTDLKKTAFTNVMTELINVLGNEMKDEESIDSIYHLLEVCLKDINDHDDTLFMNLGLFMANILYLIGISPEVDECILCGNSKVNGISVEDGGFVCENCSTIHDDVLLLKQFRLINKARYQNLEVLKQFGPYGYKLCELLYQFLENYLSIQLNSWKFMKEIISL